MENKLPPPKEVGSPIIYHVKKEPVKFFKYEDPEARIKETASAIENRKQNANYYFNEYGKPGQFLLILSDLYKYDPLSRDNPKDPLKNKVQFYQHVLKIINNCEFFEFTEKDFKTFVLALKEFGCKTYKEEHQFFKPTGSRELTETVDLVDNVEAPLEITDRLLKAENFESTRTLIKNGALKSWLSAQTQQKENDNQSKKTNFQVLDSESIEPSNQ